MNIHKFFQSHHYIIFNIGIKYYLRRQEQGKCNPNFYHFFYLTSCIFQEPETAENVEASEVEDELAKEIEELKSSDDKTEQRKFSVVNTDIKGVVFIKTTVSTYYYFPYREVEELKLKSL